MRSQKLAWCSVCGLSSTKKPFCRGAEGVGRHAARRVRRRIKGLPPRTGRKHNEKCEECRGGPVNHLTGLCWKCEGANGRKNQTD
jgi:hypothetical protein